MKAIDKKWKAQKKLFRVKLSPTYFVGTITPLHVRDIPRWLSHRQINGSLVLQQFLKDLQKLITAGDNLVNALQQACSSDAPRRHSVLEFQTPQDVPRRLSDHARTDPLVLCLRNMGAQRERRCSSDTL